MKRLLMILIGLSLIPGCTKWNLNRILDCQCENIELNALSQDQPNSDLEQNYFDIWKRNIKLRSGWSEKDYNDHIFVEELTINDYDSGISLRIDYYYTIDWAVVKHHDDLMILFKSTTSYQYLGIPRNEYLSEDWVLTIIDSNVGSTSLTTFNNVKKLKFSSCQDACIELNKETGFESIENFYFTMKTPGQIPRINGDPYMRGSGIIDYDKNRCSYGYINLITGESVGDEGPCIIYN